MSGVWTKEMDEELLDRKDRRKLAWRVVAPLDGMSRTRCQNRYRFLKSGVEKPEVRQGTKVEPTKIDGLLWLERKRRITPSQLLEAFAYRDLFRDAGDLSMQSQLSSLGSVRGGAVGGYAHQTGIVGLTAAKRGLFVVRHQVLRGQTDMLTVMDGVCGLGHTVRYLAGGDQIRAHELEAVLRVALDLLVAYREAARSAA